MPDFQVTIPSRDSRVFGAYIARPTNPNGNAIVLLQEIFGVTKAIRQVADRYAQAGYLVLAPDLFWRMEPGIELSYSRDDIQRAMALLAAFDQEAGLQDIQATAEYVRAQPGFTGKITVAGLCLGGLLAYLACTRPGFDSGIGFYGVGIENQLDVHTKIKCPLLLHFGCKDDHVPVAAQQSIRETLGTSDKVKLYFYEEAGHGFYTRGKPEDMALAHERSLNFLKESA